MWVRSAKVKALATKFDRQSQERHGAMAPRLDRAMAPRLDRAIVPRLDRAMASRLDRAAPTRSHDIGRCQVHGAPPGGISCSIVAAPPP